MRRGDDYDSSFRLTCVFERVSFWVLVLISEVVSLYLQQQQQQPSSTKRCDSSIGGRIAYQVVVVIHQTQ